MKFLLAALNSKFIHTNLAVYSLKSYAGELALHVEIGEYTINHNADFILQDIYERKPDVIGFSCYIWNYEYIKLLAENLAKVLPEVPIWLGGPEVSYDAEKELSSFPHLKGIMMGEGEEIFRKLLSHYVENTPELREIPGLCYREKDEIFCNPAAEILDMSQIPFPYQDGDDFSHKIVYYESSRGCPFACSDFLSSLYLSLIHI